MKTSRLLQNSFRSKSVICASYIFMLFVVGAWPAQTINAQTAAAKTADSSAATTQGKSTVSGRVVYEDNGRPVRHAQVMLINKEGGPTRNTSTDKSGKFVIKNVVAGSYTWMIEATGVSSPSPYTGMNVDANVVSVDGTGNTEIEIRAQRGGIITGKVVYADGDPAINASISVMRKDSGHYTPIRISHSYESLRTDDRGVYRIAGLPPGEYIVSAAEDSMRIQENGDGSYYGGAGSLSATYYPSATTTQSATTLRVEAGREVGDINITLIERALHKVSGIVTAKSTGLPLARVQISAQLKGEPSDHLINNMFAHTDERGRWTLDDVPDGSYTLMVYPPQPEIQATDGQTFQRLMREARSRFVMKRQDVVVGGGDVSGLAIELTDGARISGTIKIEGDKPLAQNIIISAKSLSGDKNTQQMPSRAERDGTWMVGGLQSGENLLSVFAGNKYYVKSITWNGMDLQRNPVNLDEGGEVKGVEIILSADVATLTGHALSATDGTPLRNILVMLISTDQSRWRFSNASSSSRVTGPDGSFQITGAPGEYFAIVWRMSDGPLAINDETIRERTANAPRVILQAGERKSMDLRLPQKP